MNLNFFSLPRRRPTVKKSTPAPIDLFDFLTEAQLEQHYSSLTRDLQLTGVAQLNRVADWQLRDCGLTPLESRRLRRQLHRECPQSALSRLRRLLFPQQQQQRLLPSNHQHPEEYQYRQQQQQQLTQRHRPSAVAFGLTSFSVQTGPLSSATLPRPTTALTKTTVALIQRERLRLGRRLGSGRFGEVRQATLLGCSEESSASVPVAVRILRLPRPGVEAEECRRRVERLLALDHPGLASILGLTEEVATDDEEEEDENSSCSGCLLVMEFAPLRSLLECLRDASLLTSFHVGALCEFGQQAAQALSYLENRHLPHGSVSARSLLVFAKDRVKLADAGLVDALDRPSSHALNDAWTAPELLQLATDRRCSRDHPADVWSFGATLWEMFSFGSEPWPERLQEADARPLEALLRSGRRLECPDACPVAHYQLMLRCWRWQPAERPTFAQIASHLPKIIPEKLVAVSHSPAKEVDGEEEQDIRQLKFHAGDVIIVLDDNVQRQDGGVCNRGIRVGGDLKTGRFDRRLTRPLLPGDAVLSQEVTVSREAAALTATSAEACSSGTASASGGASGALKMVTRRATLGASYAKEFGQKICRVKKAAQARLQSIGSPSSSIAADDVERRSQQGSQDAPSPAMRKSQRVRLTSAMISEPLRGDFRHAGHVGADGSVFGDVACLSELELRPTCEPPPALPGRGGDGGDTSSTMLGEVRYRSHKRQEIAEGVEPVDALRCQSGYCRLGSSLSLGIETVGGRSSSMTASAAGSYIGDYADSWDWRSQDAETRHSAISSSCGGDLEHLESGAPNEDEDNLDAVDHFSVNGRNSSDDNNNNNNNGSSLIDEILRAWCSVTASASEIEGVAPASTVVAAQLSNHESASPQTGSFSSSSSSSTDEAGPAVPDDGAAAASSSDTATPSTSISSLNNGEATTRSLGSEDQLLEDSSGDRSRPPEETGLQQPQQQPPQPQQQPPLPQQQLFVSTMVTASSSCSSSLSSVGSVASLAEAAPSYLCVGCGSPGGGCGLVGSWETATTAATEAAENRHSCQHSGEHSSHPSPRLAAASPHSQPQLLATEGGCAQEARVASSVYSDDEEIMDI